MIYPFNVQSWVSVKTTGEAGVPVKRRDHATILLSTTEHYACLFMTGGIDKQWHSLGDAWILNLQRDGENITRGSWLKVNMIIAVAIVSIIIHITIYAWQNSIIRTKMTAKYVHNPA